jgi:hypothetical protein
MGERQWQLSGSPLPTAVAAIAALLARACVIDGEAIVCDESARLYGFRDVVDSEAMLVRLLRRFREERTYPNSENQRPNRYST